MGGSGGLLIKGGLRDEDFDFGADQLSGPTSRVGSQGDIEGRQFTIRE